LLAIFLALALLISPVAVVYADGPIPPREGNELDGHPWDDESTETIPDPEDDPNTPGNSSDPGDQLPINLPTTATSGSGPQFIAQLTRVLVAKWLNITETKVTKSKTVQRIR
jgi:hypothetical protein